VAEEKPFEPTQSRLAAAARDGDVARSSELVNVAAFAAALGGTMAIVIPARNAAGAAIVSAVSRAPSAAPTVQLCLLACVPLAAAAAGAALCAVLQGGGVRATAVSFKFERLSPAENLKRSFSRESAVTAARAIAAFCCAAAAIVPAIGALCGASLQAAAAPAIAQAAWQAALRTALVAGCAGAVFAAADYGLQVVRRRKRLRMSHDELRRDQKDHDGDPATRSRRRSAHRRIIRGSLQRVKDAAFVVTNPTHLAVALEYRPPGVPVPRVIVRAADEAAVRVRELASSHRIPIVENVRLARLLYTGCQDGQIILPETYVAVAEIVAALTQSVRP
jgi:flagellar biosynthetic protein FlhB